MSVWIDFVASAPVLNEYVDPDSLLNEYVDRTPPMNEYVGPDRNHYPALTLTLTDTLCWP